MSMRIILIAILMQVVPFAYGQKDPVAGSILEKFSARALEAQSVTISFDLMVKDEVNSEESSSSGKLVIKKNLYKLDLTDNIVWFDGKAVWTLVPEVEEVTITNPDTSTASFLSSPEQIFTIYREGYKYRLLEETSNGSVIDLYPEDADAEFIRIRLLISKTYDLSEAEYKRKDGYTMLVRIKSYSLNNKYEDSYFTFDKSKYRNVDVIDMR